MKTERFRDLLDIRGAAIGGWPADEREEARRLLAAEPSAREALAAAERLERLLGRLPASPDAGAAAARIIESLRALPPQRRPWVPWAMPMARPGVGALWPRIAALAMVAGLGILVGVSDLALAPDLGDGDMSALIFDADLGVGVPR
ncbi:MAG: hypothetical protein HY521_02190 [Proteobacteria bacterium]|nr:hypothetical protein [Pseudomonadota bacterium]